MREYRVDSVYTGRRTAMDSEDTPAQSVLIIGGQIRSDQSCDLTTDQQSKLHYRWSIGTLHSSQASRERTPECYSLGGNFVLFSILEKKNIFEILLCSWSCIGKLKVSGAAGRLVD